MALARADLPRGLVSGRELVILPLWACISSVQLHIALRGDLDQLNQGNMGSLGFQ